jgi:small-conductance mechanosensitive channel
MARPSPPVAGRLAFLDHAGALATLVRMKRAWNEMNPTLRGFLIIGLIVVVVVVLQLQTTVAALFLLAQIAFFLAIAYFVFLVWRDRRQEISMWSSRSRVVFYGAAVLLVVHVAVRFWEPVGGGWNLIAFLAVFVLAGFAMWRVWRDEHTYGY